ncbi:universal stress protein [Daejeonella oryzae]|uniref:universal stress protein n=1 Tax=Daejeonella oryzae TaxID=1122943 RepID=UPI000415BE17|nr:universal stress protein [Daejeonella oryzae]
MISPDNLKKILIAVEDSIYSDSAVNYGLALARKFGAEVVLVHVNEIPTATPYIADPMLNETSFMMPEMMNIQEEASKKLFERIQAQAGEGIVLHTYSKIGTPKVEILATADECNADLIILGTHGRTGFDHFISGSVSESVLRKSKCPVLIIPSKDKDHTDDE